MTQATPPADQSTDTQTGVSPEHAVVQFPDGSTAHLPASVASNPDRLSAVSHAIYSAGNDAVSSAWQEAGDQAKGLKSMLSRPDPNAPADERHVSTFLGPLSGSIYKMGKQVAAAVAQAHLANQQGEGAIGTNLELYRNLPVVGDLVRDFESGKVTEGVTRGLVRAAIMHGVGKAADLSATALATPAPEVSAVTGDTAISAPRLAARKGFTPNPAADALNPTPTTVAPLSLEQRLANSFMRKQRLEPQGTVESNESNEPVTQTVKTANATDELRDFITKHFGKGAKSSVEQVHGAGEGPHEINIGGRTPGPTLAVSAAEAAQQDALVRGYLAKLESKAAPDQVEMLQNIRKRLGLTKALSPEAEATMGAKPTAEALAGLKTKLGNKDVMNGSDERNPRLLVWVSECS